MLPEQVVAGEQLSDAQLESVVLAGQAHEGHLAAGWETLVPQTVQRVDTEAGDADDPDHEFVDDDGPLSGPVRFRRGWMLGTAPAAARAARSPR